MATSRSAARQRIAVDLPRAHEKQAALTIDNVTQFLFDRCASMDEADQRLHMLQSKTGRTLLSGGTLTEEVLRAARLRCQNHWLPSHTASGTREHLRARKIEREARMMEESRKHYLESATDYCDSLRGSDSCSVKQLLQGMEVISEDDEPALTGVDDL